MKARYQTEAVGAVAVDADTYNKKGAVPALVLLSAGLMVSMIDRTVFSVLMQSIKEDLSFSDTQLGFLSGIAFGSFYATFGLLLAHVADHGNRKRLVAWCVLVWSGFAALSGMAYNFVVMALARFGVAIGEAGLSPSAQSLLVDFFREQVRGRVLGAYMSCAGIGIFLGYGAGGYFNQLIGWRWTFVVLAAPGFVLALAMFLFLREPARKHVPEAKGFSVGGIGRALQAVWRAKAYRYLAIAGSFNAFLAQGFGVWSPSFLIRSHDMDPAEVGAFVALTKGVGAIIGTFMGGYVIDFLARRDVRWYAWISLSAMLLSVPCFLISLLSPSLAWVAPCFLIITMTSALNMAPTFAAASRLVPSNIQAISIAAFLFGTTFIGIGLGPQIVGILSDLFSEAYGQESLRIALLFAVAGNIAAAILFWRAAAHIPNEIDRYVTAP